MDQHQLAYKAEIMSPFKFVIGMLMKLPSIVFWGIRIKELNEQVCVISLPFTWRTQNPFRSIYFAALAGAAEFSSGILCQMYLHGRPPHAMLVVDFRAEFFKKADQKIYFTCDQGLVLREKLDSLTKSGDSGTIAMISSGRNQDGVEVAKFYITWSFKRKG
jgi:Domain of unknown function (DUF4442)